MRNYLLLISFSFAAAALAQSPLSQNPLGNGPLSEIFTPNLHIDLAASSIDGAEYDDLLLGAHDPNDDFVVQGIEPAVSLRTDYLEGFANWNFFYDGDEWGDENEEAFLKLVNLPGDVSIRGGRMLARFGDQNPKHLHARDWRDSPFVLTSFLGDEGLVFEGGDITVPLNFVSGANVALTVGFGDAREHDHHGDEDDHGHDDEHGDEDEGHHDDEDGDHHDEDEGDHHDEDEHGHDDGDEHHDDDEEHGHSEEELAFANELATVRLVAGWNNTDFHQFKSGVSVAFGEDEDGEDLTVSGVDLTYTWRENGFEPDGRELRWTTEVLMRDHDDSQFGASSQALYRFDSPLAAGLRVGMLELEEDDLFRVSPLLAWHAHENAIVRLQGNHIELPEGDAQSVTLGLSMRLGPDGEVR